MTDFMQRAYAGERDFEQVIDLLLATRTGKFLYRYPTFWRLELLLASRLWEPERDARVWLMEDGSFVGFAYLLHRQRESVDCTFETLMHPAAYGAQLYTEMFDWVQMRVSERAREIGQDSVLSTTIDQGESELALVLEQRGFSLENNCNLLMRATVPLQMPEPVLPAGYTLRPLNGEAELATYEAVYNDNFTPINRAHRLKLLHSPEYCHLVIEAPDGSLVAYCEGSTCREEWRRSGLRVGWIDYIGTLPGERRRGLGLVLLLAMFQQFQVWGVETVMLITMCENTQAQGLYRKVGFRDYEFDRCARRSYPV